MSLENAAASSSPSSSSATSSWPCCSRSVSRCRTPPPACSRSACCSPPWPRATGRSGLHGPGLHQRPRHPRGAGRLPRRRRGPRGRPAVAGLRPGAARLLRRRPCSVLYALQRFQPHLPLSLGFPGVAPDLAFNTAASFVTNTNWQSYSGESTMGHLVQMAGLAVQNFVSAAVGIAVAVALIRGFARSRTDRVGQLLGGPRRGICASCCPLAFVAAVVLVALGAVQNFSPAPTVTTLAGQSQTITGARSPPRRRSRSWAPTAAASTTPTPRTRSRTRPRRPTSSRSSCCC